MQYSFFCAKKYLAMFFLQDCELNPRNGKFTKLHINMFDLLYMEISRTSVIWLFLGHFTVICVDIKCQLDFS